MSKGLVVNTCVIRPSQLLYVAFTVCFVLNSAFGSSHHKCSKPACNINAIGHRKLVKDQNWYSPEKEKDMGDKFSAALEKKVEVLKDESVTNYVDRVAHRIAQNSDAEVPITVRIIRSRAVSTFTLPGGHLYLTSGLILLLTTEGELASVLGRGIAHTALHSAAREQTRASLMQMGSIPFVFLGQQQAYSASGLDFGPGMLALGTCM